MAEAPLPTPTKLASTFQASGLSAGCVSTCRSLCYSFSWLRFYRPTKNVLCASFTGQWFLSGVCCYRSTVAVGGKGFWEASALHRLHSSREEYSSCIDLITGQLNSINSGVCNCSGSSACHGLTSKVHLLWHRGNCSNVFSRSWTTGP